MVAFTVKVVHGSNDGVFALPVGASVSAVRASLVHAFNLSEGAIPFFNGRLVPNSHRVGGDGTLEFVVPNGCKGGEEMDSSSYWPTHPVAELFPRLTPEERAELKKDMQDRVDRGLEPLESPIILHGLQIVDGRHRAEIWKELAVEGACNGYFKARKPPTQSMRETNGNLHAWMRAKSANMVHRQIPADQKAAIFLKAVETLPELKDVIETIKSENDQRKKGGKPLDDSAQRLNTNQAVAQMAGVGETTIKNAKRLKDKAPEKLDEVAEGKKSIQQAEKELEEADRLKTPPKDGSTKNGETQAPKEKAKDEPFNIGDVIYSVDLDRGLSICRFTVQAIEDDCCFNKDNEPFPGDLFRDQKEAEKYWRSQIQKKLKDGPDVIDGDSDQ